MNTIVLQPSDVLFFRDGRPMGGASSGQGAAWPLPSVINHAFHAALHRAEFEGVHKHVPGRSSSQRDYSDKNREEKGRLFGCLSTAGPFPIRIDGGTHEWFFPRPADAHTEGGPMLFPVQNRGASNLPQPLRFALGSTQPPSKEIPNNWWNEDAWNEYLQHPQRAHLESRSVFLRDSDFADTEHAYGIGISPESGSVVEGLFYSAHYLRMRPGWGLGVFSKALDKDLNHDLVLKLLNGSGKLIITGGQQRVCTAECLPSQRLPLPRGATITGNRVKWILLTPAIFPNINEHPGGWLPSWIDLKGRVQLLDGPGKNAAARRKVKVGEPIRARLVAAVTGKPLSVTGYALPNDSDPDRPEGGAKPTHLAVPAGAVYYFEADSPADAQKLATALNWHGDQPDPETISNRRSTLMGEKGFGLGVCGNWNFLSEHA
jgi:CRISPR type III-B/RAMP module-associated protein Cmr3